VNGAHSYEGFRRTIRLVGTGPRGSRDLSFEEARAAMAALLRGEVSDAQAGAFLVAMRLKGESAEEIAGIAQALRDAAEPLEARSERPLVACAGAYDGVTAAPQLSIAAAAVAAACGAGIVMHCGAKLGPKHGLTQADVLEALGGPARPAPADSGRMLERSGMALVYTPAAVPGWQRLADLRDQVGVRGPVHCAERLFSYFGARRFVVAFTHSPFADRVLGALERLGAERAITVRGIEGSDVVRPGRPTAFEPAGQLDLPEELGSRVTEQEPSAAGSAELTRAILGGEANGAAARAVTLSAAIQLYAAGVADGPRPAAVRAQEALTDGRAAEALDAMLDAA
jgi:anthranilate phosphoribosyltransferase